MTKPRDLRKGDQKRTRCDTINTDGPPTLWQASTLSALSLLLKHRVAQAALGLFILVAGYLFQDFWSAHPEDVEVTFVGRSSCIQCHQKEAASYQGSHHDLAMDLATEETVLADFDDATFENDGIVSRMFRDGERFMIHTEGEDGEMRDFHVKYVFGVEPLQQYMVEFDRTDETKEDEIPRVQVLRISWDTAKKKWFYLRPPDVTDKLEPDDPLHWTGIGQRWQTMCAVPPTDLKRNFFEDQSVPHDIL